jgi:hypothetical protein
MTAAVREIPAAQTDSYSEYVRRVIAEAPKPSQAQIDRIRVLLRGTKKAAN